MEGENYGGWEYRGSGRGGRLGGVAHPESGGAKIRRSGQGMGARRAHDAGTPAGIDRRRSSGPCGEARDERVGLAMVLVLPVGQ